MKTTRPALTACALAAGMLWALLGPATSALAGDPAGADAAITQAADRALTAGADPDLLESLLTRVRQENIPDPVLHSWLERVEGVALAGLPTSPLLSRYLEGIAKSVPPSRIDGAVDVLEVRLRTAARRVNAAYPAASTGNADPVRLAAIDHAAYALGLNGMSESLLDRSIALTTRKDRSSLDELQSSMLTLGILVASGIQPEQSLEVVSVAWDRGYRGNDLERLGKAVGRLGAEGEGPPADVVKAALEIIGSDVSREEVFQGLDDLNGREDYTLPGLAPGDDPTIRRGDTRRDLDPPSGSPKEPAQPKPIGGRI